MRNLFAITLCVVLNACLPDSLTDAQVQAKIYAATHDVADGNIGGDTLRVPSSDTGADVASSNQEDTGTASDADDGTDAAVEETDDTNEVADEDDAPDVQTSDDDDAETPPTDIPENGTEVEATDVVDEDTDS